MKRVEVLVAGAGVAGATAAIGLARQGLDVMLVDRAALPRHKVCGCCLNRDAVGILHALGLRQALERAGAQPIQRIGVRCGDRSLALTSKGGLALSRYALDAMLVDAAAQAGCRIHDQTSAKISGDACKPGDTVSVRCTRRGTGRPTEIQARVVLVADGLAGSCLSGSDAARRTTRSHSLRGYGAHLPADQHGLAAGEVTMHCAAGGYVGTVVLEDGALDIAAAMKPGWVKASGGPAQAVQTIMNRTGQSLQGLQVLPWRATAPLTGRRERLWQPRVFVLGDSAGYVEPFTGEGMAWAMRSAQALQPIVAQAVEKWDDRLGLDWQRVHRLAVQQRQWRCRLFSRALRRPRLVSSLIRCVGLLPGPVRQTAARSVLPPMFGPQHGPRPREFAAT